jgi:hypothetical protein
MVCSIIGLKSYGWKLCKSMKARMLDVIVECQRRKIPSLTMSAVSSPFRQHSRVHSNESAISL